MLSSLEKSSVVIGFHFSVGLMIWVVLEDNVDVLLNGAITSGSLDDGSFNDNCLEYPQYTEPYEFEGHTVPDILYCGNHEAIKK